jgi:RHS repeat-associated protein
MLSNTRRPVISFACAILAAGLSFSSGAQEVVGREWQPFDPDVVPNAAPASTAKAKSTGDGRVGSTSFSGTGKAPWDEYDKQVQASGVIGTLGPDLFGDTVEYYKNTLSFSVTDISLPGNFPLPVALTRKLAVTDRNSFNGITDLPLWDWDLDIPNISGVYAPNWGDDRCSFTNPPQASIGAPYTTGDFWNGLSANMPGGGELLRPRTDAGAAPKPTTGTYPWMTPGFAYIRCVSDAPAQNGQPAVDAVGNATGEGFEAITTDGTVYTFGWMAQNFQPELRSPWKVDDLDHTRAAPGALTRRLNALYVTRIRDRFGNTVTFTYDNAANASVRLRRIESSDNRVITLNYSGGVVNGSLYSGGVLASASAHGRTWTYQYSTGAQPSLTAVILPDTSRWTYDFAGLSYAVIEPDQDPTTQRSCDLQTPFVGGGGTGTATSPSGAIGTFTVAPMRHGRANVPRLCDGWQAVDNDPNNDVPVVPRSFDVLSIKTKRISGPNLETKEWTYSGGSLKSWAAGWNIYQPHCGAGGLPTCMEPVCVSYTANCAGTHVTTIVGKDAAGNTIDFQRITFGNNYKFDEGKLLKVERGTNSTSILETEIYNYNLAYTGQEFATPIGTSLQARAAGFASEYLRPQQSKQIVRDGVSFNSAVNLYDDFARSKNVDRFSTLLSTGNDLYRKTETTKYHDNKSVWVLGQVEQTHTIANGIDYKTSYTEFTAEDLPWKLWSFWLPTDPWRNPDQTLEYSRNPDLTIKDGTLASVTDANTRVTSFASWKRGVPQSMTLADGHTLSAVVDDWGQIKQVTDELGTVTNYDYDAMGRLWLTDYTDADTVPWTSTVRSFGTLGTTEYGIPVGSWKQTVSTGDGRTTTWFNGRWQPILVLAEDATNSATRSYVVTRYDADGRAIFKSYPVATLATIADALAGVRTEYDALGRVTHVKQDSELAASPVLDTRTEYLSGFQTRVTNPRLFATITEYQAYDTPTTDAPTRITAPETQLTVIDRDPFGKPFSITRSGTWSGASVNAVRRYVYDTNQRLCLTLEPESGMSVQDYDAVGNVSWSITGRTAVDSVCVNERARVLSDSVISEIRTQRTYDELNRLKLVNVPNSANDPTYDYFADGALKSLVNGTVRWDYTYNRRGLPESETLTFGGKVRTLGHTYDTNAHELRLVYPSGLIVNHVPNALGQASRAANFATGVSYFPNGGMKEFTYGACSGTPSLCVKHSMTPNLRQLPQRSLDQRGTDIPILDSTYTYDANGNVAGITDGGGNPGRTRDQLTYDGLDRLTHTRAPGLFWINADTTYDPLDNIRSNTVGARTWTYQYDAAKNRLTTLLKPTPTTVGYDTNGNITSHGTNGYAFDAANRLVQATGKESYAYDGHGRRVWMMRLSDTKASFPMYSLDGRLITDDDYRSNLTTDYVYLNGSLVAKQYKAIGGSTWTTRYLYTDALGSPVAESDAAGTVTKVESFTPYGEQTDTIGGAALEQGPAFTGHVTDAATGLSYMQQRYYDPGISRFLSVDPIAANAKSGAGFNRYAYAENNPYKFADPDGRCEAPTGTRICTRTKLIGAAFDGAGSDNLPDNRAFRNLAKSAGIPVYDAKAFTGAPEKEAAQRIAELKEANPKARVVLLGYSAGGDAAIRVSERLAQSGIKTDALVTFDPHNARTLMGYHSYTLSNVGVALNFFQHNPITTKFGIPFGSNPFHGGDISCSSCFNVNLTGQPVDHTSIVQYSLQNYGDQINKVIAP